jgi:hypothetical protein
MTVSFTLYKANGHAFDLLPGNDDRDFSLSNANAADVLSALAIEDSFSEVSGQSPVSGAFSSSPGASATAMPRPPSPSWRCGSRASCS